MSTDKNLNNVSVESLLHKRVSEVVGGISAKAVFHHNVESQIDFIGMDVKESGDTLIYGIGSLTLRYSAGVVEFALAAPVDRSLHCCSRADPIELP
jgi:hypothetical protein